MRIIIALAVMLSYALPVYCQTPEQVEAGLARLPADQRAYERYRFWFTTQPQDVQRAPDAMERYKSEWSAIAVRSRIKLVALRGRLTVPGTVARTNSEPRSVQLRDRPRTRPEAYST